MRMFKLHFLIYFELNLAIINCKLVQQVVQFIFKAFFIVTCSSSCIVAARGRPSTTRAIIVINTILAKF